MTSELTTSAVPFAATAAQLVARLRRSAKAVVKSMGFVARKCPPPLKLTPPPVRLGAYALPFCRLNQPDAVPATTSVGSSLPDVSRVPIGHAAHVAAVGDGALGLGAALAVAGDELGPPLGGAEGRTGGAGDGRGTGGRGG